MSAVRIKQVEILGGWFVVTGPHATPISGKFGSRAEAQNWLAERKAPKRGGGMETATPRRERR